MSQVEITPELLADVEAKAKSCRPGDTLHFDPAVVLAMIIEIERLWALREPGDYPFNLAEPMDYTELRDYYIRHNGFI